MTARTTLAALALLAVLAAGAYAATPGAVNQRGDGWPEINGVVLFNDHDGNRPLDARPGNDPFMGTDPEYTCDGRQATSPCDGFFVACGEGKLCNDVRRVHNELLGGHGSDTLFAGPEGDVLWSDFKPNGPKGQVDKITGGDGRDFIYGGPGRNVIKAGAGNDFVKSRYGRGVVDCGPGNDIVYTSRRYRKRYTFRGCERKSTGPSPGQGGSPTR
jgi:Ca2+-binding RTX toxin-like protein